MTANVAPGLLAEMQLPLIRGYQGHGINAADAAMKRCSVSSPGPVKYALGLMGMCGDELRAPLGEIADQ